MPSVNEMRNLPFMGQIMDCIDGMFVGWLLYKKFNLFGKILIFPIVYAVWFSLCLTCVLFIGSIGLLFVLFMLAFSIAVGVPVCIFYLLFVKDSLKKIREALDGQ